MANKSSSRCIFKLAVFLFVVSLNFEIYFKRDIEFRHNPKGQEMKEIEDLNKGEPILSSDGDLLVNGWGVNLASKAYVNYEDFKTCCFKSLSHLKYRAWNFYLIYTPDHVIQFHYGQFLPLCTTSIKLYDRHSDKIIEEREI